MSQKRIVKKKDNKTTLYIIFFFVFIIFTIVGLRIGFSNLYNPIKKILYDMLGPFQQAISLPVDATRGIWGHYIYLVNTKKENMMLKDEIENLKKELNSFREVRVENIRLKKILALKEEIDSPSIIANIVGIDITPFISSVVVDKGKAQGILPGMPVVSGAGLVGHVYEVTNNFSKILLLSDINSSVGAFIQDRRIPGILKGMGNGLCMLDYVNKDNIIELNEVVVTSGTDWLYPKGIIIGKIIEKKDSLTRESFLDIIVKPEVDLKKMEEVMIILKPKIDKENIE
jgi:rod shape-determining protein MreC